MMYSCKQYGWNLDFCVSHGACPQCCECSTKCTQSVSTQICLSCSDGTFSSAGATVCTTCPAGKTSTSGASVCVYPPCAPGTYRSAENCIGCSAGKYSGVTGASTATVCTNCLAGTYSSLTSASSVTVCTNCPTGSYSAVAGASVCVTCPTGSTSPSGSSSAADCVACNVGFTGPDGGPCTACVAGKYKTTSGSSACTDCGAGTYSTSTGATLAATCVSCPINTFSGASASACQPCQANATSVAGSTSQAYCYCKSGYAHVAGSYSCRICDPGTYNSQLGRTACSNCSVGLYSVNYGATGNETCLACPLGQWSPEGSPNCNLCPPNSSAPRSSGFVSNCTCGVGYTGPDGGMCSVCAAGHYKNVTGSSVCIICPAGSYSGVEGAIMCENCTTGTYSSVSGATSASVCLKCAAGTYSGVVGAMTASVCVSCPAGMSSVEGAGVCFCPANTYALPGQSCFACLANQNSPAQSTAKEACLCNAGYTGPGGLSTLPYFAGASFTNLFKSCGANMNQDCTCQSSELGFFLTYGRTCYKAFDNNVNDGNQFQAMANVCTNGAPDTYNCYWGVSSSNIQPYIMLNFGQPVDVTALEIFSSYSSGQGGDWRPKNFDIFIGDSTTMTNNIACATNQNFPDNTNGVFRTFVCVGRGQYLFIRQGLFYANYMQINEMRVPGSIPEKNNPCPACAAGSFKNVSGTAACMNCSRALYSLSGATTCLNCTDGYFVQFPNAPSKCLFNLTCSACPANTYHTNGTCTACTGNTTSVTGSTGCQCKAGFTNTSSGCQACPAGTYKRMAGTSPCRSCQANSVSDDASALCRCNAGYTAKDGDVCVACVAGKYKNVTGSAACVACAQRRNSVVAATNVTQCICDISYTQVENASMSYELVYAQACVACDIGKFKPLIGVQECTTCGQNQSSVPASPICSCVPGFTGPDGGPCAECALGKYKDWLGPQACTVCPANSLTFFTRSTLLSNCTCNVGYTGPDGGPCPACVGGKYKSVTGTSACITCDADFYSTLSIAATSCSACPAGYQSLPGTAIAADCCGFNSLPYFGQVNLARTCGASGSDGCPAYAPNYFRNDYAAFGPQNAVNGIIDNGYISACCGGSQWFLIDFQRKVTMQYVEIQGSCWWRPDWLANFNLQLSDDGGTYTNCATGQYGTTTNGCVSTHTCVGSGRFLRLTQSTEFLQLPEVRVYSVGTLCACNTGYTGANYGASKGQCTTCLAGTYKATNGSEACTLCAANTFHNITTATSVTSCLGCAENSIANAGESICLCAPGFTGPDGGPCVACEAGKFKNWRNSSVCPLCPPNSDSVPGTSLCPCNVGYTGPLGGPCVACVPGKYKDTNGTAACTTCPANSYEPDVAATLVTNCTCNTGFDGADGGPCTGCAVGKYKNNNDTTPCVPCPVDTYIDVQASPYCKACPEFTTSPSGSTSRPACQCKQGYTGIGGSSTAGLNLARSCGADGASPCATTAWSGSASFANDNYLQAFTPQDVAAFNNVYTENAVWMYVDFGKVMEVRNFALHIYGPNDWNNPNMHRFYVFASNTTTPNGVNPALPFRANSGWSESVILNDGSAQFCAREVQRIPGTSTFGTCAPADFYVSPRVNWYDDYTSINRCTCGAPVFGRYMIIWNYGKNPNYLTIIEWQIFGPPDLPCSACQIGKYKDTIGSSWCTSCPPSTFSGAVNATSIATCAACQGNSTSLLGSASKDYCQCNVGFIHQGEGCAACLPGTFNPRLAQIACSNCTVGTYSLNYGAISNETCASCSATEYSPEGSALCQPCPPNSVAPAGSSRIQDCGCTFGYTGATASLCEKCAPGSFKNITGNWLCQSCSPNSYSLSGATALTACFCNPGYTGAYGPFCVQCAIGKYKSIYGSSACVDCPANTYADRTGMTVCTSCVNTSASPVASVSIWNCTCNAGYKGPTYLDVVAHENFARSCGGMRNSACVATQSSTLTTQVAAGVFELMNPATLANDNNSSTFSMTAYGTNQWWRVDFERSVTVQAVRLLFSTFAVDMLHVHVGDVNSSTGNLICASVPVNTGSSDWVTATCSSALTGRYLYVRNSIASQVTLLEVQAQGTEVLTKIWPDWCEKCPVGTYKPVSGSAACTNCPSNSFSTRLAATSISTCTSCPANSVAAAGSDQCACDVGFSGPANACSPCGTETFKTAVGASTCETCPANSVIAPNASTLAMPCTCLSGFEPR